MKIDSKKKNLDEFTIVKIKYGLMSDFLGDIFGKININEIHVHVSVYIYFLFLGDVLLHLATRSGNERAGIFLAKNGARLNLTNNKVTLKMVLD